MYHRLTRVKHDPSEFEAIIDHFALLLPPQLDEITGLNSFQVLRTSTSEIIIVAIFDDMICASMASAWDDDIYGSLEPMMSAPPQTDEGEVVFQC